MPPKLLLFLTIPTLISSIFSFRIPTKNLAATNTIDYTNTVEKGHNGHRSQSCFPDDYRVNDQRVTTATVSTNHDQPTSTHTLLPHFNDPPPILPRMHQATPELQLHSASPASATTRPDDNRPGPAPGISSSTGFEPNSEEEKKWYRADWVNVVTWAIGLYVVGSVLGLLMLWGKGYVDRTGK
ncbi:hypothetical protein FKW77_005154 [Venturia effusa]|uniref:Uncharacterized protein n=1 Tax=Venturia effusa TaxID=50376 RepID=A0A517LR96_9PEZI|nr:hypothetical protein FKW77_005154 [Venturia effusa]